MRYLNKSVLLIFAILASLLLFSCAAPASGIDAYGDGGDVSVKQVPVGGSPFMGGVLALEQVEVDVLQVQ